MKITKLEKKIENFELSIEEMNIKEGHIHGFVGGNGCGKTTLAKLIMGVLQADTGTIDIANFNQRDITMTSQRPYLLHTTVYQNIIYPLQIRKKEIKEEIIDEWLEKFNLLDKKQQYARSLSSGERQKISLIRAMIFEPKIIIIDETLSNLDLESIEVFEKIVLSKQENNPITWIMINHQVGQLYKMCEYIHFLSKGKLIMSGRTKEVLIESKNPIITTYMNRQVVNGAINQEV